jgi:hypothetical protein
MPAVLVLRKQRQENCQFKVSLGSITKPCLKIKPERIVTTVITKIPDVVSMAVEKGTLCRCI